MLAAANGHTDIVNSLLANDANVDAIDKDGWTALTKHDEMAKRRVVRYPDDCLDTLCDHFLYHHAVHLMFPAHLG